MVFCSYEQLQLCMGVERMVRPFGNRVKRVCNNRLVFRVPDLNLDTSHPKRAFIRRVLELEIRLSYHERIKKTIPDAMQVPEALALPADEPGYDYEYELPGMPLFSITLNRTDDNSGRQPLLHCGRRSRQEITGERKDPRTSCFPRECQDRVP